MTDLLTTAEVARRLGVKRQTVYAYVSRGLLARASASKPGRSLFDRAAVDALADAARHPNRSGALEVTVRTELTALDPNGRLFYRGHDAVSFARHRSFEDVAGLLWDGDPGAPWRLEEPDRRLLAAGPVPGFGHSVYRGRDPRADHLLQRVPMVAVDPARARTVQALTDAGHELGLSPPNADFALAALSYTMDLRRDASATIFTVARIVGLIAHALEEYPHRLRFRPGPPTWEPRHPPHDSPI